MKKALGSICRFEYGKNLPDKIRLPGDVSVYGSNGIIGKHNQTITVGETEKVQLAKFIFH